MTWTDDVKSLALAAARWLGGLVIVAIGVVMLFKTTIPKWGVGVALFGVYLMIPTEVKSFFAWAVSAVGDLIKPARLP